MSSGSVQLGARHENGGFVVQVRIALLLSVCIYTEEAEKNGCLRLRATSPRIAITVPNSCSLHGGLSRVSAPTRSAGIASRAEPARPGTGWGGNRVFPGRTAHAGRNG